MSGQQSNEKFKDKLKLKKNNSLLLDNPECFISDILESLGVSRVVLNNPAFRERICDIFIDMDEKGAGKIYKIAEEIGKIYNEREELEGEYYDIPRPIDKEHHEELYRMLESLDMVEYCIKFLRDNEFISDNEKIIEKRNQHIEDSLYYRGIKIDKQTGEIGFQTINNEYADDGVKEENYQPDEKGNVIYTISFKNFLAVYTGNVFLKSVDKISKFRTFKTTYNQNGTAMKSEDINYNDDKEEGHSIRTRHQKYPFVIHDIVTLNKRTCNIGYPEGTEIYYALKLKGYKLADLNSLECDENGQYVTFNNEDEMEAYYKLHKEDIDRYLKKLGLHVETRGFDI